MFGALVLEGRSSGRLLRFHPWWSWTINYPNYIEYDRDPQNICCLSVVGHCKLYHERRPPHNCEGYVLQRRSKYIQTIYSVIIFYIYKHILNCVYQELISATKWHKGALNLRGLLVLTVVENTVMHFYHLRIMLSAEAIVALQKQMTKYTRKP